MYLVLLGISGDVPSRARGWVNQVRFGQVSLDFRTSVIRV